MRTGTRHRLAGWLLAALFGASALSPAHAAPAPALYVPADKTAAEQQTLPVLKEDALPSGADLYHGYDAPVSPVPEPSTWMMLILGVGFMVYQVKRCDRKRKTWARQ